MMPVIQQELNKIYLLMVSGTDYDDQSYTIEDGGDAQRFFLTRARAEAEAKARNRDWIREELAASIEGGSNGLGSWYAWSQCDAVDDIVEALGDLAIEVTSDDFGLEIKWNPEKLPKLPATLPFDSPKRAERVQKRVQVAEKWVEEHITDHMVDVIQEAGGAMMFYVQEVERSE